jgi:hypothetical protein
MVRMWVKNARSRKTGLISLMYLMVFSLIVRNRIMTKTRRENPIEM